MINRPSSIGVFNFSLRIFFSVDFPPSKTSLSNLISLTYSFSEELNFLWFPTRERFDNENSRGRWSV